MADKSRYTVLIRTLVFVYKDDKLLLMKYSGKGDSESQEKSDRKDIYNPVGGHVEEGEDIVESAAREAKEEAGITLIDPKIKGVINISGFAGKNIVNFIIVGRTEDEALKSTLEGELHWVSIKGVDDLNTFADIKPIIEKLTIMTPGQMFVGTAKFEGFKLLNLNLNVI